MSTPIIQEHMTTHQPWADQLCTWLPDLGDTAEQIAATLAERDITGLREDARCCPLANYVRGRLGDAAEHLVVEVDTEVEIYDGPRWAAVRWEPVQEFVERFDAGEWPELIAQDIEVTLVEVVPGEQVATAFEQTGGAQ